MIKDILLAAVGAWAFVNCLQLHERIKWMKRKPFYCEPCMAGWFFLVLYFSPWYIEIPFYMAAAMAVAVLITWLLNKTL